MIDIHGGTIEYGWQLWETFFEVLLEAEFHAVLVLVLPPVSRRALAAS